MNSFLMQSAAVGTITLIAMFPTPDRLRDALTVDQTEVLSPGQAPDALLVLPTSLDEVQIEIVAPFEMDCAKTDPVDSVLTLNGCAQSLSAFIAASEEPEVRVASAATLGAYPNPAVEQARRALIEICRLRWAMKQPPSDPATDRACEALP